MKTETSLPMQVLRLVLQARAGVIPSAQAEEDLRRYDEALRFKCRGQIYPLDKLTEVICLAQDLLRLPLHPEDEETRLPALRGLCQDLQYLLDK